MTEQTKNEKENNIVLPNEFDLKYVTKRFGSKLYKILINPVPYRLLEELIIYFQELSDKDKNKDKKEDKKIQNIEIDKKTLTILNRMILKGMSSEPKIDDEFLESDECTSNVFQFGMKLMSKVFSDNSFKQMTGFSFDIDEDIEFIDDK